MKKILVLFLLSTSFSAIAEWTYISSSNMSNVEFYVDFDRLKKQDGISSFWVLQNYPKLDKFGDFSNISKTQSDCSEMGYRDMHVYYYSAPMGKGKINISEIETSVWRYPPPNSVMETVLESVCDYVK
jgi:hypothetical protein